MMRLAVVLAVLFVLVPAARAETDALAAPSTAPFRVGGDLSVYLREDAGGSRSVLPSIGLRGAFHPLANLGVTLQYGVATLGPTGGFASAWAWVQRLSLRADGRLPIGPHVLVAGAGPAATFVATTLADRGTPVASTFVARPGVEGIVAFETRLGNQQWRASFQGLWTVGRVDFWTGLGVDFGLGEVR